MLRLLLSDNSGHPQQQHAAGPALREKEPRLARRHATPCGREERYNLSPRKN